MNDGRKRKAPKHQNKTAFKIQFDPLALEIHKKVSFKGLCKRCADQISWKLKYNKYKKMTQAAKCTFCHQKNVSRTYMRACEGCTEQRNVCPKCLQTQTQEQIQVKLNQLQQKKQDQQIQRKMNEFLKTLKERSRRTVKRLYEKEAITWDNQQQNFVDVEGNILPVQFRQGYGPNKSQGDEGSQNQSIDQFGSDFDQGEQDVSESEKADDSKKTKVKEIGEEKKPKQNEKQSNAKQIKKYKKQQAESQSNEDGDDNLDDQDDLDQEENDQDENYIENEKQQETKVKQGEDDDWQDEQGQQPEQIQQSHPKKSNKHKHKK